ncbi:MAG: hypothetical protein JWO86_4406 [Myxococcaceae bacterium]|jgi:hypothetical protein|nr:hypothetical protein [Myxococcaceae bacterium]MEA2747091.1 hypothetical protein [Myxococcales bacterium]
MSAMFANKEVASRHLPIAHGRDDKRDEKADSARDVRRASETRLQVAVVPQRKRDDVDPYADVPCTD